MHNRIRALRMTACALILTAGVCIAVVACGSSGRNSDASTLLEQTFSGNHPVNSGNMSFSLTITPSGSSSVRGPITLSFGGPFQSLGPGKLPKSHFNVSLTSQGTGQTLGIISTGNTGYITLQGVSYQLPPATFRKLESSFSGVTDNPGGGSGSGTLSRLGIHPLDWLSNPTVVGHQNLAGTSTTHIRAGINISAFLKDLGTFLEKASSLGVSGAGNLSSIPSQAARAKIAGEVRNSAFDVWTGDSDKTVRKLMIQLTLPVSGQVGGLLGGISSAGIALTMRYADLNRPQTITAPTTVRPFTELETKLRSLLGPVEQSAAGGTGHSGTSSASGTAAGGSATSSTGSSASVQRYSQCITAAHDDVAKMQQCASLINGR